MTPSVVCCAYLALGANLGDRAGSIRAALVALDAHPRIDLDPRLAVAPMYETSPVGVADDQPAYLNTVACVWTSLDANDLLDACLQIESDLGRVRTTRWAARVIDIDLLLMGDQIIESDRLVVPHPRMQERRFVLEPLSVIAPDVVHPVLHRTIRDLAADARNRPDRVLRWG